MRAALAFLTSLGGARAPDARTLAWFPLAGALIGGVLGALWWGSARLWPPAVAAGVVVAADLALTGMLHLDGLVDSADGLLSHLPRERRLTVMAEPTIGAFGVAAAGTILLMRFAALGAHHPDIALIAALWCTSRTTMAVAGRAVPYARPAGLLSAFARGDWWPIAAYGAVTSVALAVISGPAAILAVAVAAAGGAAVIAAGRSRLGGVTGDVLGAAGMIAETAGLLVAAARW